uniref:Uncharacterized protein n=1 Tax=Ranid herpesvirus 4 TaxID=2849006 RepID=A0A8F3CIM2_9VIRU|nr:MAG: hypothetical protein [Ranid herpesvirus 4]
MSVEAVCGQVLISVCIYTLLANIIFLILLLAGVILLVYLCVKKIYCACKRANVEHIDVPSVVPTNAVILNENINGPISSLPMYNQPANPKNIYYSEPPSYEEIPIDDTL